MKFCSIAHVAALVITLSSPAFADTKVAYEVTVDAGKHDRVNTPVRVVLDLSHRKGSLRIGGVDLVLDGVRSGDDAVPSQLSAVSLLDAGEGSDDRREVTFIVPSLKAGASAKYVVEGPVAVVAIGGERPNPGSTPIYHWRKSTDAATDLGFGSGIGAGPFEPVIRYVHPTLDETDAKTREQTYKPFHHVFSPDGKRIVTKGPGGQYTHHRGIYFGFNRITYGDGLKCDVWHCGKPAHQAHEKVLSCEGGFVLGRHRVQIGWHGAKGEKFAEEQRELTVYNVAGGQFIEFASVASTADGNPIKLDGDPQHAGFHFRADNEVSEKTKSQTYYLRPDGKGKPGETRNWDAKKRDPKAANEPWKVMSFVLGDARYSALYLDHPNNPKEARSSERDYGRFGSYFEYEITKDKPLRVNYRLILKEGEFTAEEAERLSADFADPPKVTVKKL